MKLLLKKFVRFLFVISFPELKKIVDIKNDFDFRTNLLNNAKISEKSKIYGPYVISNSEIGDYSYVAFNSRIHNTEIGKFCSIGPNFISGTGIHPTNGISTAPMFYSTNLSNGISLSKINKVEETKPIKIGNDVWIGINVTLLDGINIGNGAIIAAGSIVRTDVPDYAIYGGIPAKLIKYRFTENQIEKFKKIEWWNFDFEKLKEIEEMFFDVDEFLNRNQKK